MPEQEKPYDVLLRDGRDDDTETMFTGSQDDCLIYVHGYMECLIRQTAYYLHPDQANVPNFLTFYSPLISESKLEMWIMPSESNEPEDRVQILDSYS